MKNKLKIISFIGMPLVSTILPATFISCSNNNKSLEKNQEKYKENIAKISNKSFDDLRGFDDAMKRELNPVIQNYSDNYDANIKKIMTILYFFEKQDPKLTSLKNEFMTIEKETKNKSKFDRFSLLLSFINFVSKGTQQGAIKLDEKHEKIFSELVEYNDLFNSYGLWIENYYIFALANKLNSEYLNGSNGNVNTFLIKYEEILKKEFPKKKIDQESANDNKNMAIEFLDNIFPKLEKFDSNKWNKNMGFVAYRKFDNNKLEDILDNVTGEKIMINPEVSEEELSKSYISPSGWIYVPNSKTNKLDTLSFNYDNEIKTIKERKKELEAKITATPKEEDKLELLSINSELEYYEYTNKYLKNLDLVEGSNILSSHLNKLDLKDKYVIKITSSRNVKNGEFVKVNFGIKNVGINRSKQKIYTKIEYATNNGYIYPSGFANFPRKWKSFTMNPQEKLTNDIYLIVDAKHFNDAFLNGENPSQASKKDGYLKLNLSKIVEFV
ncbi:hypothetical protein [Mycoplasma crocodyli]|uniref:Putative lipoprotein n=1 Tax=Mycoplasma crocodyli (strain ATCC 51981 / MP145) TaxID=512564 RepID=D5E5X2_MYCCM|nr:hypothetical protein [Mycoplasma crocodyli]ADE19974.1 putative lipoprotein [Mycoplasma crocodyli MP145]